MIEKIVVKRKSFTWKYFAVAKEKVLEKLRLKVADLYGISLYWEGPLYLTVVFGQGLRLFWKSK